MSEEAKARAIVRADVHLHMIREQDPGPLPNGVDVHGVYCETCRSVVWILDLPVRPIDPQPTSTATTPPPAQPQDHKSRARDRPRGRGRSRAPERPHGNHSTEGPEIWIADRIAAQKGRGWNRVSLDELAKAFPKFDRKGLATRFSRARARTPKKFGTWAKISRGVYQFFPSGAASADSRSTGTRVSGSTTARRETAPETEPTSDSNERSG